MKENDFTIALLIDSENISPKHIEKLLVELIPLGRVTYKRLYVNYAKESTSDEWLKLTRDVALTPVQPDCNASGKNAIDVKLSIDAIKILYERRVNAFCIVSGDSDYTPLVKELVEQNMYVIVAGGPKTAAMLMKAADRFIELDNESDSDTAVDEKAITEPVKPEAAKPKSKNKKKQSSKAKPAEMTEVKSEEITEVLPTPEEVEDETVEQVKATKEQIIELAVSIIESYDGELMDSGELTKRIRRKYPDFEYKNYGCKSYSFFPKERFVIVRENNKNVNIGLKDDEA